MKKLTTAVLLSAAAVLAGCASTDNSKQSVDTLVISKAPYVWDSSISEALNVAKMAQPAGVGGGMRDFDNGMQANEGKASGAMRVFDAVTSGLAMGVYGVASSETLGAAAEKNLNWKPAIIDVVPVSQINDSAGQPNFRLAQEHVGSIIRASLEKAYPDLIWYGVFTPAKPNNGFYNTDFIIFSEAGCRSSIAFSSLNKNSAVPSFKGIRSGTFKENSEMVQEFCEYGGKLSIAGTTESDGELNYVLVFEVKFGNYFDPYIAKNAPAYFIVPQAHTFVALDTPVDMTVTRPMAAVFKNGAQLLFQKP
jgi:hypothetical protein